MSVFLPFNYRLLPVSRKSGAPVPLRRHCSQDIAHSDQVVAGQRHQHLKANPILADVNIRPDVLTTAALLHDPIDNNFLEPCQ